MIKLSDYLNYLNNEVIQARKKADEQSIIMAKEYAKDEYLKYFRVPRFSIPTVKLNMPIKISELDSKVTYNFKRDYDAFVSKMNNRIVKVNKEQGLDLKPIVKKELLSNKEIVNMFQKLEKHDYKPVRTIDDNLSRVNINSIAHRFIKHTRLSVAVDRGKKSKEERAAFEILKETFSDLYQPVKADLRDIFIDPDTSKATDKGKILLTLDVEMVEEGIKIRSLKDNNGNDIEEIIFE